LSYIIRTIIIIAICCATFHVFAQQPAFYHLSTAEGLSDNNVNVARRDRNGILWIGTSEGLNSFDGNRISTYYKYQYPEIPENHIAHIVIDDDNRIWLRSNTQQLTMLDEKRKFHLFTIGDTANKQSITHYFNTKSHGIVVLKNNRHYIWKDKQKKMLEEFRFTGDSLITSSIVFLGIVDEDKIFFYSNNHLRVWDYGNMKMLLNLPIRNLYNAAAINSNELLAYPLDGKTFYRIDIASQKITQEYKDLKDQYGKPIEGNLRNMTKTDGNRFAISTRFSGLYFLDIDKRSLEHWVHDPLDNRSIGGNNTYRLYYDSSGYLMITTQTSGLHYYNMKQPMAASKPYFKEESGEVFDGFIQSVATDDSIVWMGAQDRLIEWNRKKDKTSFVRLGLPDGTKLHGEETIRVVFVDEKGNLWVGTSRYGIFILDKNKKIITRLTDSVPGTNSLPSNWINNISADRYGNKWISTLRGIAMVEKDSYRVHDLSKHTLLAKASRIPSATIWFDSKDRVWIGSTRGAWCYNSAEGSLQQFSSDNGLPHDNILCFNEDDAGNIYIGTASGLSIIHPGNKISNYNRSNGLRNDRCEDILKDDKGYLWIGNLNCILRFDPRNKTFAVFEEGYGFSHAGFRMRSSHKSKTGEMFWGSDKGLLYFFPEQMSKVSLPLYPSINSLQTGDTTFHFTGNESLKFPYYTSSFVFHFSSGELGGGKKNHYLYRLSGFDDDWKTPTANGQVAFSKLPPGNYRFEIKASRDGSSWFDATYSITILVGKPWWQQTWFRVLYIVAFISLIYWMYRYRLRRKKAIEVQKMIEYFANSGYEHSSVNDILWDIARNCISRLGFEDCVIYVVDEERKVLLQKAAYGPKNPKEFEIANPIEISIGKGIVGDVALTGKASIINDTSKDKRYIMDDEQRFSEITVPIIHEEKVIAVIDSENKQKNFFTAQHLKALQTIATLCSAKISRAMAMDAMKKSKMEVMELNVKMAESKFLNLRLQMNPHFLFNSLSSIQHLIVSQQTTKAYKYLTVFSNFLRSLLKYAEDNFIPLDEELKILNMYVELESLRFDQSFHFEINVEESLSNDEVLVPSLMVQPFAENAIWHGLLHKEGHKKLKIDFKNNTDEFLTCVIEDNGIGRKKSASIRESKISSMLHDSKGINIIKERLELLQQKTGKPAHVDIQDLYNEKNEPTGTKVIITIPYYNPEET
jgi:ligand-binding sensor domain-containing protein/putative methionine-R-sulfoxide reductase with GAF domain/two-component sensor histidine kinase